MHPALISASALRRLIIVRSIVESREISATVRSRGRAADRVSIAIALSTKLCGTFGCWVAAVRVLSAARMLSVRAFWRFMRSAHGLPVMLFASIEQITPRFTIVAIRSGGIGASVISGMLHEIHSGFDRQPQPFGEVACVSAVLPRLWTSSTNAFCAASEKPSIAG